MASHVSILFTTFCIEEPEPKLFAIVPVITKLIPLRHMTLHVPPVAKVLLFVACQLSELWGLVASQEFTIHNHWINKSYKMTWMFSSSSAYDYSKKRSEPIIELEGCKSREIIKLPV
jgi:hypothetical protein